MKTTKKVQIIIAADIDVTNISAYIKTLLKNTDFDNQFNYEFDITTRRCSKHSTPVVPVAPINSSPATIIQNAVKIDDEILISRYVHDYKTLGKIYIDGGLEYFRDNIEWAKIKYGNRIEDLRLASDMPMSTLKAKMVWGTMGPEGKGPLTFKKLIECETAHLLNILRTQKNLKVLTKKVIHEILVDRGYE